MLTPNPRDVESTLRTIATAAFPDLTLAPFVVETKAQESKSRHGDWTWYGGRRPARIRLFNLARPTAAIVRTSVHEIGHHVDFALRGRTDHSKPFYVAYKRLLETAHRLGVVDLGAIRDEIEGRDIRALVRAAGPFVLGPLSAEAEARRARWVVRVGEGYAIREQLKAGRFVFSATERAWVREVEDEAAARTLGEAVARLGGRDVAIMPAASREIETVYFVIVESAGTYGRQDELKALGLTWRPEYGWFARLPARKALLVQAQLARLGLKAKCRGELPGMAAKRRAAQRRAAQSTERKRRP